MLKRRLESFRFAFNGLAELFRSQANAKIHLAATIAVSLLGWWLRLSATEWAMVALTVAAVFAAEAFNTAIEYLTDLISPGHHPLAGKAKDVAAAGVLLAALGAAAVGGLLFLPKLLALL